MKHVPKKTRAALLALLASLAVNPLPLPALEISTNLTEVSYHSNAWPFSDFMKSASHWMTFNASNGSRSNLDAEFFNHADANGWPTKIPFMGSNGSNQVIEKLWSDAEIPTGTWTITWRGQGKVEFKTDGTWQGYDSSAVADDTVVHSFTKTRTGTGSMQLRVSKSNPNNSATQYVRDIQVVAPNQFNTNTKKPNSTFHPTYIESLSIYKGPLRFMDWGRTNGSGVTTTRTSQSNHTQSVNSGVSVEYMVELANTTNRDLWYCVPHKADNTYIETVATLIKDTLNTNLRVWVEYSNEVWNPDFGQHAWARSQRTDQSWMKVYAERSANAWKIFRTQFGAEADTRVVRVLAGQRVSPTGIETIYNNVVDATNNPHGGLPDVLSPASYIPNNVYPSSDSFDSSGWGGGINGDLGQVTWSGDWSPSNTTNVIKVLAPGSTSDRRVEITNNGSITRTLNTSTASNGTLYVGLDWSATGLESGETASVEVYNSATNTWNTAGTLADGADDGAIKKVHSVGMAITPGTNTQVRIKLAGNDPDDKLLVHSIRLVGHLSPADLEARFTQSLETELVHLAKWTKFAALKNIVVYAYEGGQHFTGQNGAENDNTLTSLFKQFNRSQAAYDLYVDWLDRLQDINVAGIAHYFDMGSDSKWGYWGAFQKHSEALADRHKYRALKEWTPGFLALSADTVSSFAEQDLTQTYSITTPANSPTEIKLGPGNVWKKIPFGYRVTNKTRVKFEFKSDAPGDLHGIGFETDNVQTDTRLYKIYGSQSWSRLGQSYTATGGAWQQLNFPISHVAGSIINIVLINDHDIPSPNATGWFRNIQVYEGP